MGLEEVCAGVLADKSAQPFDTPDEAVEGLVWEEADAQEPSPGLDKDEAELAAILTAFVTQLLALLLL